MTNNDEELEKLLPRLVLDDTDSRREALADIDEKHTSEAQGINVDYMFYIENLKDSDFSKKSFRIEPLYADIFKKIKEIFTETDDYDLLFIIDYVKKTSIIKASKDLSRESRQEYYNYCVGLADRYIPIISLDIDHKLISIAEKKLLLNQVYMDTKNKIELDCLNGNIENNKIKDLDNKYSNNKTELKKELCNYIMLWIHAYRFLKARQQLLSLNKDVVAFSHRYQGWSKPRQKINDVLDIEFKTNFGYGNSSYFYLLLVYKGVKIYPFMDWINYKYAEASEMEGYSEQFHEKLVHVRVYKGKKIITKEIVIEQYFWDQAFDRLVVACNICEKSSEDFINIYIISALKGLVSALELMIDEDDTILNGKYRDFDFGFTKFAGIEEYMKEVKLMSVKGSMISKTLDFVGDITKLEEIISVSSYINDIESLNKRILPMLEKTIFSCEKIMSYMGKRFDDYEKEIIDIWKNQGLEEYTKKYKAKKLTGKESIIFDELQEKHNKLSELKGKAKQDLDHSRSLLKSIERYIVNIKNYFNTTK